jgi:uncharacterized OB-fold protein
MFRLPEHDRAVIHLLGSQCGNCGETFFPARHFCAACSSGDMAEVELASSGTVETYTIVHQQLTGSVMVPPYAIVRVALKGGPVVQTVMVQDSGAGVEIGDPVDIVALPISTTNDGSKVVSFAARPASSNGGGK